MVTRPLSNGLKIQKDLQTIPATVSVIIPAYQASKTIGCALKSVATQTVLPNEVIVIDDGSDDDTFEAVKKMAGAMNGIGFKILHQEHKSAGTARNKGLNGAAEKHKEILNSL